MADLFLEDGRDIRTVLADPPWNCERGGGESTRGAQRHYGLLGREEIVATIQHDCPAWPRLCDSAHLYLWTTNTALASGDAHWVVRRLGFEPKTMITWVKRTDKGPQMGLGFYFRHCTEQLLFYVRGDTLETEGDALTVLEAPRTEHSRKPDLTYDLIEQASPGAYLELFARRRRPGWISWGDEL